jgi:hypothetical protein
MDEGRRSYVSQEEHMIVHNWQAKVRALFPAMLLVCCLSITSAAEAASHEAQKPIILKTMGSLFFGGTVTRAENGETFHGDHGSPSIIFPRPPAITRW